ncbi:hypothetical protein MNB_ARC-1_1227 [hydrothermal vent metagenome]|uniref:Uncharacterized protein n=1 Tax=hydrothermal vent metagenome TaxID=652676 RepID=A0A3B1E6S3_9ZZZZ
MAETTSSSINYKEYFVKSFLKLPSGGYHYSNGNMRNGGIGLLWSNSLDENGSSMYLYFNKVVKQSSTWAGKVKGLPVRCISISQSGVSWKGLTYNTITSSQAYKAEINVTRNGATKTYPVGTHRVWLDKNLGASRACKDHNDADCFGDYYQWGRGADGHEKSDSNTTPTKATSTSNVGHGKFIYGSNDWANTDNNGSIRSANWLDINGRSVCPAGYRVPTKAEFKEENISNRDMAYEILKMPSAGSRNYNNGSLERSGLDGFLWSSSPSGLLSGSSLYSFQEDIGSLPTAGLLNVGSSRANGLTVRCIQD